MMQTPATPGKQKYKVQYEKVLHEYCQSDDIVIKSPMKCQDSPVKNRRAFSPLKRHNSPSSSATDSFLSSQTPPTFVGIPHAFPLAPLHIDDDINIPCKEKERRITCKFTIELGTRRFYTFSWMVGMFILMFLSLRFSVSNLPNQLDFGLEMKKEFHHITYHHDNKAINTQARYDATTIISNAWDETVDGIAAESSAPDSLTTKHDGSAIGAESDLAESSKVIDAVNVGNNENGSHDSFDTQHFLSPYSAYKKNATHKPRFAYTYVISGCNEEAPHRNYLYDISISTYLQREAGSTADVIIYIQMAYESKLDELVDQDRNLLDAMNIHVKYIPKTAEESFYRTMLDKFLILGLVQYERVLFMDGDVLARGNLDYLFDLSVRGVLKRNIVTAGKTEPANGGFFMLAPTDNATDRMMAIIRNKEDRGKKLPYPHWDENVGWGHKFEEGDFARLNNGRQHDKWNFYGAFADQGLLYHWVKYEEKSVSIIHRNSVENWDVDRNGTLFIDQNLGMEIFNDYNFDRICWNTRPCKTPFKDFMHFTGKSKPWLVSPPEGFETDSTSSPPHFWYNTLHILNEKMKLGIDFSQWRQFHRPLHGLYPTHSSASKTSYALSQGQNETNAVKEKR